MSEVSEATPLVDGLKPLVKYGFGDSPPFPVNEVDQNIICPLKGEFVL